jgi:dTDP-4-dehydrorhamnose reductase
MRLLITGAGGMLGRDVDAAARDAGHDVTALARADLDICDPAGVRRGIAEVRPEVVVNCAAWTDVDGAESQCEAARAVNVIGAGHIAMAAVELGAWTIHVSTDYVFDGRKREPYVESDPVSPLGDYGRSKLDGERAINAAAPDAHTIVRTAWLFGAHGSCFPATMLRLAAERDELTVVEDQVGCPTFTGHLAAALVAIAGDPDRPTGAMHVAGDGQCSWAEFARATVEAAGLTTPVRGIRAVEYPTPAERPAYSVLRSERGAPQLPPWRDGLREFLAETTEMTA